MKKWIDTEVTEQKIFEAVKQNIGVIFEDISYLGISISAGMKAALEAAPEVETNVEPIGVIRADDLDRFKRLRERLG